MSILKAISDAIFKDKSESSAVSAKQRLHLVLINDRAGRSTPDYMPKLRQEIFEVLKSTFKLILSKTLSLILPIKTIPQSWKCLFL